MKALQLYINGHVFDVGSDGTTAPDIVRAVRGADSITLHDSDGTIIATLSGIADWSAIRLTYRDDDSPAEFETMEPEPDYTAFLAGLMEGYNG